MEHGQLVSSQVPRAPVLPFGRQFSGHRLLVFVFLFVPVLGGHALHYMVFASGVDRLDRLSALA